MGAERGANISDGRLKKGRSGDVDGGSRGGQTYQTVG